jgi:DNA-binding transcriptional MerR regulator
LCSMNQRFRTGELARLSGVSNDTIRHYEKKGVIPAASRDANGYRSYPVEAAARVQLVRSALAIGFTLDELARIFMQRASGRPPCNHVRTLGAQKLASLEARIAELLSLRDVLSSTLASWDERLDGVESGQPAHLLDSLIERRK